MSGYPVKSGNPVFRQSGISYLWSGSGIRCQASVQKQTRSRSVWLPDCLIARSQMQITDPSSRIWSGIG